MARNCCLVASVMVALDHPTGKKHPQVPAFVITSHYYLVTLTMEIFLAKLQIHFL